MLMLAGNVDAFKNHQNWRSVVETFRMNVLKTKYLEHIDGISCFSLFVWQKEKKKRKINEKSNRTPVTKSMNINMLIEWEKKWVKTASRMATECDSWFIYRRCCDFEGNITEHFNRPSISSSLRLYGERSISLHHFYWFGLSQACLWCFRSFSLALVLCAILVSTLIQ